MPESKIKFCPLCAREAVATCDECEIQFCGIHHDTHDCDEVRRKLSEEKAKAWLIGQKYARQNLDQVALQHAKKEQEKEELEEMVAKTIENLGEENGEESEQSSQEER